MTKFFNVLKEDNTARIFLYGEVGDGQRVDSLRVVQELEELERQYTNIEIRINSNGGDVFSGMAIYNAIKSSKADIKIYIDSVAASIAAVIALCGRPLYMAKFSKLMMHNVSGSAYGNAAELIATAEMLKELENDLAAMVSAKCKMTPEEVKTRYFDGGEHWLSADECLDMGLINGIYDISNDEIKKNTERVARTNKDTTPLEDYDKMVNKAVKLGIIDSAQRAAFVALAKSDKTAFENYIRQERTKQITSIRNEISNNLSGRAYLASDHELLQEIGQKIGFDKFKQLLNLIRPFARVDAYIKNQAQPNWTLEDYRRHDPLFLLDNPDFYNQLKRKYGEPKKVDLLDDLRKNRPDVLASNPNLYEDLIKQKFSS